MRTSKPATRFSPGRAQASSTDPPASSQKASVSSSEDYTDDDGLGNGPIKLKLAMWREGDELHLDWNGTDAQVPGPVNFLLNKDVPDVRGVFLISAVDQTILFNGYADVIKVNIPDGTVLRP